jgi:signal transduction histidine kinase
MTYRLNQPVIALKPQYSNGMARAVAWPVRTLGLVVVGLLTFLGPPTERGGAAAQFASFALVCAGTGLWAWTDLRVRSAFARLRALGGALGLVTVAACVGASAGGTDGLIAFAMIAMLAAAETLPLAATLTIGALGVLAIEIGGVVFDQGAGLLLGYPLLLAVGALTGRNRAALRTQAEQARALLAQEKLLRAEQRRADVLDERSRIAREIHDVLAHSLGALGIQLQTVKALLNAQNDLERALGALTHAQRMASEGLTETRRAVHALRTDTLPVHEEIARAGAELAERHSVTVRCETSGTPRPLTPEVTVALLRIAQEALVNAVKHAPGHEIETHLDYRPGSVRLTVINPLKAPRQHGPAAALPADLHTLDTGYGLTGMHERLRLLRGTLAVGIRGDRWVVQAELPTQDATGQTRSEPTESPDPASISVPTREDRP